MRKSKTLNLLSFFLILGASGAIAEEVSVPNPPSKNPPVSQLKSESGKSYFEVQEKDGEKRIGFYVLLRDEKFVELRDIGQAIQKSIDSARADLLKLCREKSSLVDLEFKNKSISSGRVLQKIDSSLKVVPRVTHKDQQPQPPEEAPAAFKLKDGAVVQLTEHYIIDETADSTHVVLDANLEAKIQIAFVDDGGSPTYNVKLKTETILSCD